MECSEAQCLSQNKLTMIHCIASKNYTNIPTIDLNIHLAQVITANQEVSK